MDKQIPVTQWLSAWRDGDVDARDALITALYPELRRLAERQFQQEGPCHTLQPTALVNEAWMRLAGSTPLAAVDRNHLLCITARLMRQILIDHARRLASSKRKGGCRVTLSAIDKVASPSVEMDVFALDDAMNRLSTLDPCKARIVELRYFGGLTVEETAQAVGQSPATVKRHWQAARLWLYHALEENAPVLRG